MAFINQVGTFLNGVSAVANDINSLKSSYYNLSKTVSKNTGGLVKLPTLSTSASSKLKTIDRVGMHVDNILTILGLSNSGIAGIGSNVQVSNTNVASGSFKWVEMETTPESFATADSVLIFAGDPLYSNLDTGAELVPIGMCQGFSFSSGVSVVPFKELRCEENIIYPGKSQPGAISMTRLCGAYSNLANRLHILPGWNYSTQSGDFKKLFGLMVMFLTPGRQNSISTLYFERCAVTSFNVGVSASNYQIMDNLNIMYGRCITVGELTTAASVSTATTPTASETTAANQYGSTAATNALGDELTVLGNKVNIRSELPDQLKDTGLVTENPNAITSKTIVK